MQIILSILMFIVGIAVMTVSFKAKKELEELGRKRRELHISFE